MKSRMNRIQTQKSARENEPNQRVIGLNSVNPVSAFSTPMNHGLEPDHIL
jgi:hypothetical protein